MQVIVQLIGAVSVTVSLPLFNVNGGVVTIENSNQSYQVTATAPATIVVPDSLVELENTQGTTLQSASLPATEGLLLVAPDATYNLDNTEGSTLFLGSIPSFDNETIIAPDGTGNVKNSANATVATGLIPSGGSANITAPDGTILINGDSSFPTIPSGGLENILVENTQGSPVGSFDPNSNSWVVGNATYEVKDQNNNTLATGSIPSADFDTINVTVPQDAEVVAGVVTGTDFVEFTFLQPIQVDVTSVQNGGVSALVIRKNTNIVTVPFSINQNDVIRLEYTTFVGTTEIKLIGDYV
jgi:hypothetical protein